MEISMLKNSSFMGVIFMVFFLSGYSQNQVISIDSLHLPSYKKSNYFFIQPYIGSIVVNTGHSNLKSKLEASDVELSPFNDLIFFGLATKREKWLYGFELGLPLFSEFNSRNNMNTYVIDGTRMVNVDLGYSIIERENFAFLIKGGIGFQERQISVNRTPQSAQFDFENFDDTPLQSWPNFTHQDMTLNFGLEFLPKPRQKSTVLMSGKIGYTHGVGKPLWRAEGVQLSNVSRDRISSLYFRVSIAIVQSRN